MRSHVPAPAWFVLRTPLHALDLFLEWTNGAAGAPLDQRAEALRRELHGLVARPELREALRLASPAVAEALDSGALTPELDSVLVAYLARACARCTPFGLFAGYSIGRLASRTRLSLGPSACHRRHTQLHSSTTAAVVRALEERLRRSLSYVANSSLCQRGEHWQYIEGVGHGHARRHQFVRVAASAPLQAVIDAVAAGPASFRTLADVAYAAAAVEGASREEAAEFVEALITNEVLTSTCTPPCTGDLSLVHVARTLHGIDGDAAAAAASREVEQLAAAVAALDRAPIGTTIGRAIGNPAGYPISAQAGAGATDGAQTPGDLVRAIAGDQVPCDYHVSLIKRGGRLTLGTNVIAAIDDGVQVLHAIGQDMVDARLAAFVHAFPERFGDAEVPLLDALDDEIGIGFGDAGLEELGLAVPIDLPKPGSFEEVPALTARDERLLNRLSEPGLLASGVLTLSDEDVQALSVADRPPLPDAFHVSVSLAARDAAAIDRGDFQALLHNIVGPSGARMLGRFAQGDRAMRALIERHVEAEARAAPQRIYAEIVHLPDDAVANVVTRPVLRQYQIPFLGESGAPRERQIPLHEVLVRVVDGRVELRWPKVNGSIVPRLTCSHNYFQRRPVIYRFLCSLQMQGYRQPTRWFWGALVTLPYLPRLTWRRTVLARARWRLAASELTPLRQVSDAGARFAAVQAWRASRGIPRLGRLVDDDHELLIDFDNPLSADCFLHFTRGARPPQLCEQYPSADESCTTGDGGRYVHELFVLYARRPPAAEAEAAAPAAGAEGAGSRPSSHRPPPAVPIYVPGSEWIYLKLYPAAHDLDRLMLAAQEALSEPARAAREIDGWFFMRYADPHVHLRVRLHAASADSAAAALSRAVCWARRLTDAGAAARFQIETYQPELHRYGGPQAMPLVHRIFEADSDAAADIVRIVRDGGQRSIRPLAVMLSIGELLKDLGLQGARREDACRVCRDAVASLFTIDRQTKRALGQLFREERARAGAFLDDPQGHEDAAPIAGVLARRSEAIRPLVRELEAMELKGCLTRPLRSIVPSLVHMNVNRLLRQPSAEYELVLFDLLARQLTARAARGSDRDAPPSAPRAPSPPQPPG